jgi:AcrR family transcriptional regulator
MSSRLTRSQQTDRNRGLVLDAARRLFLERGYHGATLEQIADEAGFSKGVVYSQFDSKADLFLELVGQRIQERAQQHAKLAARIAGSGDYAALIDGLRQADNDLPGWLLLVIEFRVHAARDPELTRRLAAGHARTVDGVADVLATVARPGQKLPVPARQLAEALLVLSSGAALEQVAMPSGPGASSLADMVTQILEGSRHDIPSDSRY